MERISNGELTIATDTRNYFEPPLLPIAAAGLVSTAQDYLRFARCFLNRGELDGVRIPAARDLCSS